MGCRVQVLGNFLELQPGSRLRPVLAFSRGRGFGTCGLRFDI